ERAGVHLPDEAVAAHIGDGVVADDQTRRRRPGERVAILGRAAVPALLDAALPGGGHVDPGSVHVLDHVVLDRHIVEPRGFALGGIVGGVDLELDAARAAEVLLPLPVHVVNVEALETVVVTLAVVFEGDDDAAAFVLVVIAFLGVGVGDVQVADLPVLLVPQLDDGVDAAAVDFRLLSFAERVDDDRGTGFTGALRAERAVARRAGNEQDVVTGLEDGVVDRLQVVDGRIDRAGAAIGSLAVDEREVAEAIIGMRGRRPEGREWQRQGSRGGNAQWSKPPISGWCHEFSSSRGAAMLTPLGRQRVRIGMSGTGELAGAAAERVRDLHVRIRASVLVASSRVATRQAWPKPWERRMIAGRASQSIPAKAAMIVAASAATWAVEPPLAVAPENVRSSGRSRRLARALREAGAPG